MNFNGFSIFFRHGSKKHVPKRIGYTKGAIVLLVMVNVVEGPPKRKAFWRWIFMNGVVNGHVGNVSYQETGTKNESIFSENQPKKQKENCGETQRRNDW